MRSESALTIKDVYVKAQELGFQGTLDELISMFKGEKGEKGDDGLDGAGIASVRIDENGLLVITLTDGTKLPGVDLSAATGQTQAESNLHFMLSPTKDSYVVAGIGMEESSEVVIPSTYEGLPVTEIDEESLEACSSLSKIVIFDSATVMSDCTFAGCDSLTIYSEATFQPSGWGLSWNVFRPVYWYAEQKPTTRDNYWRYNDKGEIVVLE